RPTMGKSGLWAKDPTLGGNQKSIGGNGKRSKDVEGRSSQNDRVIRWMAKHEEKYCPRCNALFECKVGSISLCQCTTVKVSREERLYFDQFYTDCLCVDCMRELKSEYGIQQHKNKLKRILGVYFKE